ncbi:MAG: hypothetical protein ChlgKO_02400 [Chlamydiales bacterium]
MSAISSDNTVAFCSSGENFSNTDLQTLSAWNDLNNTLYSSAHTKLKAVLKNNPTSIYAHYLLGIYYLKVFHLRSALSSFNNVLIHSQNSKPFFLSEILSRGKVMRSSLELCNQLERKIPSSSLYSDIFVVCIENPNLSAQMDFSSRISCLNSCINREGRLSNLARAKKIRLLFTKSDFNYEDLNECTTLFLQLAAREALDAKLSSFFEEKITYLIELFSDSESCCDPAFLAKCIQVERCINRVTRQNLPRKDQ